MGGTPKGEYPEGRLGERERDTMLQHSGGGESKLGECGLGRESTFRKRDCFYNRRSH